MSRIRFLTDVALRLIEAGSDVDQIDENGKTALMRRGPRSN